MFKFKDRDFCPICQLALVVAVIAILTGVVLIFSGTSHAEVGGSAKLLRYEILAGGSTVYAVWEMHPKRGDIHLQYRPIDAKAELRNGQWHWCRGEQCTPIQSATPGYLVIETVKGGKK